MDSMNPYEDGEDGGSWGAGQESPGKLVSGAGIRPEKAARYQLVQLSVARNGSNKYT